MTETSHLTKQQQHLLKAIETVLAPALERNKVEIANMVGFHMNLNTDSVNKLYNKLNNIEPKAVIGWQCRRKSWPQDMWSSVTLFHSGEINFPPFSGDDWQFRHVYVDV